ncbi:PEGA domain-containing protein [Pelagicoccus sp. SDUM812002]|uniref:PEGA domain-containing protein n=1 Tax=Pelagicoccus sp. SDUM812002 TaxID=3041266 RepID=UPI00280D5EAE|nr:PEGA domain-containing protein [Pelagicoccus sp. SDUM812002]MDQ8188323.1 PEGA domain-containing protein [Pelagicoccus sp. SDUM812002]
MPLESSSPKEPEPVNVRARMHRSETSGRWFAVLYRAIGLGGIGFCYWFFAQVYVPGEKAKTHLAENQAYARQLRGAVGSLGEWSTQESFDAVRAQLLKFDEREDAELVVRTQLWNQFSEAYGPRAERMRKFDSLMREIRDFSLDSNKESLLAMQERMRLASGRFEKPLMQQLETAWGPKRDEIADLLGLFGTSGTGALEVRSVPSGARLFLNDREVGKTPLTADGIKAGNLQLGLKHAKYYDYNYSIKIEEYGILSLTDLEMKPRKGGVEITVVGGNSSDEIKVELICVREDGETFDYVNSFEGVYVSVPKLIIGSYDVVVYVNGRLRQSTKLEVIEGSVSRWTARL